MLLIFQNNKLLKKWLVGQKCLTLFDQARDKEKFESSKISIICALKLLNQYFVFKDEINAIFSETTVVLRTCLYLQNTIHPSIQGEIIMSRKS